MKGTKTAFLLLVLLSFFFSLQNLKNQIMTTNLVITIYFLLGLFFMFLLFSCLSSVSVFVYVLFFLRISFKNLFFSLLVGWRWGFHFTGVINFIFFPLNIGEINEIHFIEMNCLIAPLSTYSPYRFTRDDFMRGQFYITISFCFTFSKGEKILCFLIDCCQFRCQNVKWFGKLWGLKLGFSRNVKNNIFFIMFNFRKAFAMVKMSWGLSIH